MSDLATQTPQALPAAGEPPDLHLTFDPPPLHGEVSVRRFFFIHAMAAVFPLTASVALYGWRALIAATLVIVSASVGLAIWRVVGRRGRRISIAHGVWLATLLALTMPAHLASVTYPGAPTTHAVWPVLAGAGLSLAILLWVFGGAGSGRIQPVLVIYLLIVVLFSELMVPHFMLHRHRVASGDLIDAPVPERPAIGEAAAVRKDAWFSYYDMPLHDGIYMEPASERLISFTTGRLTPDRAALSLEELIRDRMPPLEDLLVGGQPGPLGLGSIVAVIMGGLFLLYRGLIDFRVPVFIILSAIAALILLPIPVAVIENVRHWQPIARGGVGWPVAVTFVNYELMAGPLLFTALYLAPSPGVRPTTRRGRAVYACFIGVAAAAFQLYLDVSYGPYLALLMAGLITPSLDKLFRPRALV